MIIYECSLVSMNALDEFWVKRTTFGWIGDGIGWKFDDNHTIWDNLEVMFPSPKKFNRTTKI